MPYLPAKVVKALLREGLLQPVALWARRRCKILYRRFMESPESNPVLLFAAKERWRESSALVRFIERGVERMDDE